LVKSILRGMRSFDKGGRSKASIAPRIVGGLQWFGEDNSDQVRWEVDLKRKKDEKIRVKEVKWEFLL